MKLTHYKSKRLHRVLAFLLSLVLLLGASPVFAVGDGGWDAAALTKELTDQANAALLAPASDGFPLAFVLSGYQLPENGSELDTSDFPQGKLEISAAYDAGDGPATAEVALPVGDYTLQFDETCNGYAVGGIQVNGAPLEQKERTVSFSITEDTAATLSYALTPEPLGTADSLDPYVSKITLTHKGQTIDLTNQDDTVELEDVKVGDGVTVRYEFQIEEPYQNGFQTGVDYPVTIPEKGFTYDLNAKEIEIKNADGEAIATLYLDPESAKASIRFTAPITALSDVISGWFTYEGKIAATDGGDDGDLVFSVAGKDVTVVIKPEGGDSTDGGTTTKVGKPVVGKGLLALWTVNIAPIEDATTPGFPANLVIEDKMRLDGDEDQLIHELRNIKSIGMEMADGTNTPLKEGEDYTLTKGVPDGGFTIALKKSFATGKNLKIEYYSALSAEGFQYLARPSQELSVKNTVTVYNNNLKPEQAGREWGFAEATIKQTAEMFLKKFTKKTATTATWRLYVNKNFMQIPQGATITENLPDGLTLKEDSLKVYLLQEGYLDRVEDVKDLTYLTLYYDDVSNQDYLSVASNAEGKPVFTLEKAIDRPLVIEFETAFPESWGDKQVFTNSATFTAWGHGITSSEGTGALNSNVVRKASVVVRVPIRAAGWDVYFGNTTGSITLTDKMESNQKLIAGDKALAAQYQDNALVGETGKTFAEFYKTQYNYGGVDIGFAANSGKDPFATIYLWRINGTVQNANTTTAVIGEPIALPIGQAVPIPGERATATATYTSGKNGENGELKITIDGPLKNAYRVRFWTQISTGLYGAADSNTAPDKLLNENAANYIKTWLPQIGVSNTVSLGGYSATATAKGTSGNVDRLFDKTIDSAFNKNSHAITWTLNANRWSLPLTQFKVVDTLPAGFDLVDRNNVVCNDRPQDAITVTANRYIAQSNGISYAYGEDYTITKNGQNIVVRFNGTVYTDVTVKIRTKISNEALQSQIDSALEKNPKKATITWKNKGGQSGYDTDGVRRVTGDDEDQSITIIPASKSAKYSGKDLISWTVKLNENKIDFPNTNGQVITDQLQVSGLPQGVSPTEVVEDPTNVQLKIEPRTGGAQTIPLDMNVSTEHHWYEYDPDTLTLKVHLVTAFGEGQYDTNAYTLTYDTRIKVPDTLKNTDSISIKNGVNWYKGGNSASVNNIKISNVAAGVNWKEKGRLTIRKYAAKDGSADTPDTDTPLSGARFSVYDAAGNPVGGGFTNKYGEFSLILSPGEYTVKEDAAPRGYVASTDTQEGIEVTVVPGETTAENNWLHVANVPIRGGIKIMKYEADAEGNPIKTIPLAGAKFGLFHKGAAADAEPIETVITDDTGEAVFANLTYGDYEVRELEAPQNYKLAANPQTESIKDMNFLYEHVFVNELILGELTVVKSDGTTEASALLSGAKFTLWSKDGQTQIGEEQETDENGEARFTALRPGEYLLRETQAPAGYEKIEEDIPVTIVPGETTAENNRKTVVNTRIHGGIRVFKYEADAEGNPIKTIPLAGAIFGLFVVDAAPDAGPLQTVTTDENGSATFKDVKYGSYVVRELQAPTGYVLNATPQPVSVLEPNHTYEATFANAPILGGVKITKMSEKDENNTQTLLTGAVFELLAQDGATVVRDAREVDENGQIQFDGLRLGKYFVRETQAPTGYNRLVDPIAVEIVQNDQNNIVYLNVTNTPTNNGGENPGEEIPPTDVPTGTPGNTGGGNRRPVVDTGGLTTEEVEQLIEDGYVPLAEAPDLTPQEIIDNQIPLAYMPPDEAEEITVEEALPAAGVPRTGDSAPIALLLLLMMGSLGGIAVLARKRKEEHIQ